MSALETLGQEEDEFKSSQFYQMSFIFVSTQMIWNKMFILEKLKISLGVS